MAKRLFVPFTKVDEEKREVWGRLTQEIVDRDGEIWDYEKSVPHMREWSQSFETATDGKSLGNLRAMHQPISAGKLIAIEYNDVEKAVDIGTKIVDDEEWNKTLEGLYTGFSLGGRVVSSWRDKDNPKFKRFEIRPIEASLADMPCVPTATFDYIKVGGLSETRHFKKIKAESSMPTTFADPANRRLPIETKAQTTVSLAVWGKTSLRTKYAAEQQGAIDGALAAASAAHAIGALTSEKIAASDYTKGLSDVSWLADLISSLACVQQCAASERDWEGDASTVPDDLRTAVASLLSILETMVGEEGDELLRMLGMDDAMMMEMVAKAKAADGETSAAAASTKPSVVAAATDQSGDAPANPSEDPTGGSAAESSEKVAVADTTKTHTKGHLSELQDLHDTGKVVMKMMTDHCEKIAGMITGGTPDGDDAMAEKVAGADFRKVVAERDDWQKRAGEAEARATAAESDRVRLMSEKAALEQQADELAEYGEKLMAALETKKGTLIAVDRESDGRSAFATTASTKTEDATSDEPPKTYSRDNFLKSMKKTFSRPRITGITIAQ